ncbi:cytochrome P450 [Microdochium trichocladiopsis]|uniref:Cytochrome P450 n=1 Tax=Microdochium trichocladiopsis TaxID=1682393 RepID=A0A9P8Y5Q8_9PEZI|nr:cytochrome P450 [Microdochium trichocladiopsis]KAH7028130.1 cytochrome P450 [Microdochium trichocladiopsis]
MTTSALTEGSRLQLVLPAAAVFLLLYVTSVVVYRIFFHPFAKYPGPFLGKVSNYVTWTSTFRQDKTQTMYRLMRQYGSPLRIGHDTLLFADAQAWTDIYGQHSRPFDKEAMLPKLFTATGAPNVLSTDDRQYHARLRRLMSSDFSARGVLRFESLIADKVDALMEHVFYPSAAAAAAAAAGPGEQGEEVEEKEEDGAWFDVWEPAQKHYLDIISHLVFGTSFNCIKGENPSALFDVNSFATVVPARYFFPAIRYLPIPAFQKAVLGLNHLIKFSRDHVTEYAMALEKEMGRSGEDEKSEAGAITGDGDSKSQSFLRNLVTSRDPETGTRLSVDELVENAIIFLVGGSGTTAVVTTYFIWECARNRDTHQRLVEEVRGAFPARDVMPTYEAASKLPLLNSMIQETMRLWGPLNIMFLRVSPGREVSGHYIPPGKTASILSYAAARDPDVFPDPETFEPERCLHPTAEMKALSRPFATGPRNCVGRHLAEVQLTLTLARIFQLYDVEVDPLTTREDMKLRDKGVMEPWAARLRIRVSPAPPRSC